MSFGENKAERVRNRSGRYCQVCGEWHPGNYLAAHSLDRSHKDPGIAVCPDNLCHGKIHRVTNDPRELKRVSLEAVSLNSLSMAVNMLRDGESEERTRRVVARASRTDD